MAPEQARRMRAVQHKFRMRGLTLNMEALKGVLAFFDNSSSSLNETEALELLLTEIDKQARKSSSLIFACCIVVVEDRYWQGLIISWSLHCWSLICSSCSEEQRNRERRDRSSAQSMDRIERVWSQADAASHRCIPSASYQLRLHSQSLPSVSSSLLPSGQFLPFFPLGLEGERERITLCPALGSGFRV